MKRILGLIEWESGGRLLVQEGPLLKLAPRRNPEPDLFLSSLLLERDLRVGNGRATGEGVFDFRYGPFTGGLGETGVLHLSTYGERILGVEIDLSVKHRGVEEALAGLPAAAALPLVEGVCGNFAFAHAHAFSRAVEAALEIILDERQQRLAIVALELERIYNHLHVIARLAEAAAQRVLAAHLGSLFEEALRCNRELAGSRFLRGIRAPGEVRLPAGADLASVSARVEALRARFERLYRASLSNRNYLDRLHGIAPVAASAAGERSLSGPSIRATGTPDDLRAFEALIPDFATVTHEEGDSLARMEVRGDEILQSCAIVAEQIGSIVGEASKRKRAGARRSAQAGTPIAASSRDGGLAGSGVGAAEGPSGVVAWAVALEGGRVARAYASTPSLFGYQVFAEALTGHIFTDFPFALDSFGLSFADAAR